MLRAGSHLLACFPLRLGVPVTYSPDQLQPCLEPDLPEQKSVEGEHMAGVSFPPHLGYLQGLLDALTGSGDT